MHSHSLYKKASLYLPEDRDIPSNKSEWKANHMPRMKLMKVITGGGAVNKNTIRMNQWMNRISR